MRYIIGFFIKYLTQQKKNALIVQSSFSFWKFGGAEISADPQKDLLQKRIKKLEKAKKSY